MMGEPVRHKDPVCGMRLEEADVQATASHQGRTYRFCSAACRQKFEESPDRYAVVRTQENPFDRNCSA